MGVSPDRIVITAVTEGSVIVDFKITQTGGEATEPTAAEALAVLVADVADETTDEFAPLAPLSAMADETAAVSLQPVDAGGVALLGWFTRGPEATIGLADLFAFAPAFGASVGDALYDAKFDLDGPDSEPDGTIGLADLFKFAPEFGKTVANADEIIAALE